MAKQPSKTKDVTEAFDDGTGEVAGPSPTGDQDGPTIESNVPIPNIMRRKYPFDKMKPGDSFEVRADKALVTELGETKALQRLRSSLSSSAASYAKRNPRFKLVVRKTGPATLRCWAVQKADDE